MLLAYVGLSVAGFLLGGILPSYHLPKMLKGVDIVKVSDDGNPGMYNAAVHAGMPIGLLCLLMDMGKGFVPVFIAAQEFGTESILFVPVMITPLLGHIIAPYYRFAGGKGNATAFGVLFGLLPENLLVFALCILFALFSTLIKIKPHTRRVTVTYMAFSLVAVVQAIIIHSIFIACGAVLMSAIVVHRFAKSKVCDPPIPRVG